MSVSQPGPGGRHSFTMDIADRFLIIERGTFVYEETRDKVDSAKIHAYLTI